MKRKTIINITAILHSQVHNQDVRFHAIQKKKNEMKEPVINEWQNAKHRSKAHIGES